MMFLENLSKLLYDNHLTRSDLSRAIDIPASTINSWYSRGCDGVALSSLIKIANYFNVTLDYLVLGDDTTKNTKEKENLTKEEIATLKRLALYADKLKDL